MTPIDPALRIRLVELSVSDLGRSADFYQRALGLGLIEREQNRALLGARPSEPSLELVALDGPASAPPRSTGLFHVAWLHPSRASLADTVRRVAGTGWPIDGAADHGVSEALYLSDPDGLGIEIYADRPRESWQRPADGRGVSMVTLALDLEDLLEQSMDTPQPAMTAGIGIGHVHLKVADVPRAADFYEGLGFEPQANLPSAAFVSAGGYHHHLGMNSWQSAGGRPAPADAPGLRLVDFRLSGPEAVERVAEAAARRGAQSDIEGGVLTLSDPDGGRVSFSASAQPLAAPSSSS